MQIMNSLLFTTRNNTTLRLSGLSTLSIAAIITILLYSTANAIEIKGMSYIAEGTNDGLLTADSDASLADARRIGCNWITLCPIWFQDNINSTLITPDNSSSTPESVIHAIRRCHELGMKVMLKPHVQCRDKVWCGNINPSEAWFATYQNFINFWAQVANSNNVELLCIGAELSHTTTWSLSWRNVIQNIRTHYTGPLIYGANTDEEQYIDWWDAVDYIGIDAYYPLTDVNNPTLAQLETAWSNRADVIESWRNSYWPNRQIIFTEVGYRSVDGANKAPWSLPSPYLVDLQEQADCYKALLSQCKDRQWWSGVFWWNWEADPNFVGPDPNNAHYTPYNKPAEAVLVDCFVCLKGDFTGDSKVNVEDLNTLASYWLSYHPAVDISPAPDGDGIIDYHDFAVFAKNWMVYLNLNGDINGDCKVDFNDLSRLTGKWLSTCIPGGLPEDINRDGHVNLADYSMLAGSWMQASSP